MTSPAPHGARPDVREARELYPAAASLAYFNTASVGLASTTLAEVLHRAVNEWTARGLDFSACEAAAERSRGQVARLLGTTPDNLAQIASVSAAAGFVAAQLPPASTGWNVVIGEREFSSNHFPWRMLADRGYEVRQVPFRNGGVEPETIESYVDGATQLVAFSAVQTASGHRSDIGGIAEIAHAQGAIVFVDGTQAVGALSLVEELPSIDVLAVPDHKYLLNAARGVGYCYLSTAMQQRFRPTSPGWKAGRRPAESYFGPTMDLSDTASRFDHSIGWLAALGDEAALAVFDRFGADAIYARNRELTEVLREALRDAGWPPTELPEVNRSTIVAVPLDGREPGPLLAELASRGVVCSARDGNLRLAVNFYNNADDVARLVDALPR